MCTYLQFPSFGARIMKVAAVATDFTADTFRTSGLQPHPLRIDFVARVAVAVVGTDREADLDLLRQIGLREVAGARRRIARLRLIGVRREHAALLQRAHDVRDARLGAHREIEPATRRRRRRDGREGYDDV